MDARKRNKLNLSFGSLSAAQLVALTRRVYNAMKNNEKIPKPDGSLAPTIDALLEGGISLEESLAATQAGDRTQGQLQMREALHAECVQRLTKIGHYVQLTVGDDGPLLATSGFDLARPRNSAVSKGPLATPEKLSITNLDAPGAIHVTVSPVKGAVSYQIQYTKGDPSVEENWEHLDVLGSASDKIDTLQSCTKYSLRARAIGRTEKSLWSSPVTMVVT